MADLDKMWGDDYFESIPHDMRIKKMRFSFLGKEMFIMTDDSRSKYISMFFELLDTDSDFDVVKEKIVDSYISDNTSRYRSGLTTDQFIRNVMGFGEIVDQAEPLYRKYLLAKSRNSKIDDIVD